MFQGPQWGRTPQAEQDVLTVFLPIMFQRSQWGRVAQVEQNVFDSVSLIMFQGPQWGRTSLVLYLLYTCLLLGFRGLSEGEWFKLNRTFLTVFLPVMFSGASVRENGSSWTERFWQCFSPLCFRGLSEGRAAQAEQDVFDSVSPCYVSGASVRESGSSWAGCFWHCFSLLCFRGLSEGEQLKLNRTFLRVFLPVMFQGPQWGRAAQVEQNVFDSVSLLLHFRGLSEGERLKLNRTFLTVFLLLCFRGLSEGERLKLNRTFLIVFLSHYVSEASVRENSSSWTGWFWHCFSSLYFRGLSEGKRLKLNRMFLTVFLSLCFRGLSEGEWLKLNRTVLTVFLSLCFRGLSEGEWLKLNRMFLTVFLCVMFQGPQSGRTAQAEQNIFDSVSPRYVSGASVRENGSSLTGRFWQCFSPLCFRGLSEGERLKLNRTFLTVFLPVMFQGPQWGRTAQAEQDVFDSVSPCYVSGASVRESGSSWTERFWQCFSLLCFRGLSEGERLKLSRTFLTVLLPVMFQRPRWGRTAQAEQDVFDSVSPCYVSGASVRESSSSWIGRFWQCLSRYVSGASVRESGSSWTGRFSRNVGARTEQSRVSTGLSR